MRAEALTYLLTIAEKQGYVIMNDIMDSADRFSLSYQDIDWLSNSIAERGVLIYEEAPNRASISGETEYNDFAQIDYEEIYSRVIERAPELAGLIEIIKNIVPPQWREIDRLKYQILEGNLHARRRMIEMHLRHCVKLALNRATQYDLDLQDTLSDAFVGLIIAVDKYKPDENGAFSAYATMWMIQTISRNQLVCSPSFYYPVHIKDPCIAAQQLLKDNGLLDEQGITDERLARNLIAESNSEYSSKKINTIVNALTPLDSYEMLLEELAEDDVLIEDYPENLVYEADLDDYMDQELLKETVSRLLEGLKPREKEVIELRFGLTGLPPQTLEGLGQEYGLTRERIRQIEATAIRKLKIPSRLKLLSRFYDLGLSESDLLKISEEPKNKKATKNPNAQMQ